MKIVNKMKKKIKKGKEKRRNIKRKKREIIMKIHIYQLVQIIKILFQIINLKEIF